MKRIRKVFTMLLIFSGVAMAEWSGEYYHKHSQPQVQSGSYLLEDVSLNGNESILDIGCGSGKLTAIIAQKVPHGKVTGIDTSESMIKYAKNEFKTCPNISFEQCNVLDIDYNSQFDVVTSFACLHYVADQQKAFINIARSLKENGFAYLNFAASFDHLPIMHAWEEISSTKKWSSYKLSFKQFPFFTPTKEEALVMLEHAKLTGQVELIEKKYRFKNIEEYKVWLKGFLVGFKQFASLSSELQDEFLQEVIELYLEYGSNDQDECVVHIVPNLKIYATKTSK